MVDTAELNAHHQNDRQLFRLRPVGEGQGIRERRKPAAGAFHQHPVGETFQLTQPAGEPGRGDRPPFVGADDVRGGRLGEGIGVHLVVTQRDPTMTLQRQRIFITQPIAGKLATGGHRLIAGSVKTQQIRRLQQGAAGDGFTDFSIGPGDKKTFSHAQ